MTKQSVVVRHALVGVVALVIAYGFWLTRPQWSAEMRFWRAVGDASFVLLLWTLLIGPLARHWAPVARLVPWRRETGIWFGLLALGHTLLTLHGWARWDVMRFLGYEFVPELGRYARLEPGFGLANLVGLIAMLLTLTLVATSSNWAIELLGGPAWKWLQYGAYIIFYLVALHTAYFLFMHYTPSFHRPTPPDPNWFRYPFLILALAVPALQVSAFVRTVIRNKGASGKSSRLIERGVRRRELRAQAQRPSRPSS
jgi:sulfoxide reductase heme-binding subunit YedZ